MNAPPAGLRAHLPAIENALRAAIGDEDLPVAAACRYVMGWEDLHGRPALARGKRIRPALCLYAAGLFGPANVAMPGACGIELVHNFSLVHDEVQDHDAERHGRPTLWALLGTAQAMNAGDYLYAKAQQVLLAGEGPVELRLAAWRTLTEATTKMIEGQWADLSFETRDDVSADEYLAMIAGKTGALLGAPLEMGASMAGAPGEVARALGRWGEAIGLAFQAHDDYLGTWGDPNLTGKSNTNDIARGKKTLPVIHALAAPEGALIREIYARGEVDAGAVAEVVDVLNRLGSDDYTRGVAASKAAEAAAILDGLELADTVKAELRGMGEYLVRRDG